MSKFDSKEFGRRLKNYRIQKGLSQENMAMSLNKSKATISRYESGEILPDVRDVSIICKELGIYEADLYGNNVNRTMQQDKSRNPFNTDKLYIYFNAYDFRTKRFKPDKYILELEQKQDICKAKFVDYHEKIVKKLLTRIKSLYIMDIQKKQKRRKKKRWKEQPMKTLRL